MQFGEIRNIEISGNRKKETTVKFRQGNTIVSQEVYKERVEVMQVTDLDTIIERMHHDHVLSDEYGAWVEKTKHGKMYVVKYWVVTKLNQ